MKSWNSFFLFLGLALLLGLTLGLAVHPFAAKNYEFDNKTVTLKFGQQALTFFGDGQVKGNVLYLHISQQLEQVPVDTQWFEAPLARMRQQPLVKAQLPDTLYGYVRYQTKRSRLPQPFDRNFNLNLVSEWTVR